MAPGGADIFKVPYEASDFPPASPLNGPGALAVTWDELLWAAVTVGKCQTDVFRHGSYSIAEMLHRISCFQAYYVVKDGHLGLSPVFKHLDPTEKGLVSYYTGMTVAKLYADKILGIPWMMHISRYAATWAIRYGAKPDRPDLFGCNASGEWAVVEAKGRSRVTGLLITKMKHQKSAVATINNYPPQYRIGSATRFQAQQLSLRVIDPPRRRIAHEVPLDPAAWLIDYLAPLVDLVRSLETRREEELVYGLLPGSDVEIGIPDETIQVVDESRERQFQRPAPRLPQDDGMENLRDGSLAEQTPHENRAIVQRLTTIATRVRDVHGGYADGVVLRSDRG